MKIEIHNFRACNNAYNNAGDLAQLMPPRTWEGDHTSDQLAIYREAMRLYCAMEDKSAFSTKFKFNDDIKNI